MAVVCRKCGKGYDVTLFEFGHSVICDCGEVVKLFLGKLEKKGSNFEKDGVQSGSDSFSLEGEERMEEKEIGKITHYFGKIEVAVLELTSDLKVGDTIHIKGHSEDFSQTVDSMQIEHENIPEAKAGQSVGMKVTQKVHPGDIVYLVTE